MPSISPLVPVMVFCRKLIKLFPHLTVGYADELRSETGLELLKQESVEVLVSASEEDYLIKLDDRDNWDCRGIPPVILTRDPGVLGSVTTFCDPEVVEILTVLAPLCPDPSRCF